MNKSRTKYLLHATVRRIDSEQEGFDDAQAGHPIERRLNRLERVSAAHHGQIDLRFNNGMLVTFESADEAMLGACEMQHRCAVLPQVSQHRLALRIGIHQCVIRQRLKDDADDARDIVMQLAQADDGILISKAVFDGLNNELHRIVRPLDNGIPGIAVFTIDWRRELPLSAYGGESFWPTSMHSLPVGPHLLLHHELKTLALTENNTVATIGRDPSCDIMLNDTHVSRRHCRIERTPGGILLTDLSTNGTCIVTDDGVEFLVKGKSVALKGKGILLFGRPFRGERRGGVRYEAF